ncbi:hydrogenase accessory protein HypB [Bradyrhizobium sacchari]|uniref:Hydrogenase maturation factor HypB n=1 Tax=Bradyrhizobium sacchari TaxID=1399419 RepID=A0A560JMQ7_9BRAD|nr:hydrogenase nickel incorporation protein HypB [Bradyrhizobium sacchari]OPY94623.1 hydrogenase accessory protein HypB [Bradyrhizobium sacchari]TWB51346.1 hydrogenase nickel incorporation protein HypB [Bradyrhizobium sacchari]TWB69580.1 hydrogenase nickel incorporation protein HypB [Bradyrhizobium sacchari]
MCTVCGCTEGAPTNHAKTNHSESHERCDAHMQDDYNRHSALPQRDQRPSHAGDSHISHRRSAHQQAHGLQALPSGGVGPAGLKVGGVSRERVIEIERDILGKNNGIAAVNRALFVADDLLVFNLLSSPGAGKTTLLARAVSELKRRRLVGVIEGDQQTSNDAERIRAAGVPAVQVNTGKNCHLDAAMIGEAYRHLPPLTGGILFIENVGNLICPAAFDLGEACKIVVFSITEGEDKPLKYPDMFAASSLMVINKVDLAPLLDFDLGKTIEYARRVNPKIDVLVVSARTGEGFGALYAWIDKQTGDQRRTVEDSRL